MFIHFISLIYVNFSHLMRQVNKKIHDHSLKHYEVYSGEDPTTFDNPFLSPRSKLYTIMTHSGFTEMPLCCS